MSAVADTIASLNQDGQEMVTIGSVMLALSITAVLLRYWAKSYNEKEYGLDDALIGIALVAYIISESLVLRGIIVGRDAYDEHSPQYITFMLLSWIYSFLYWSVIGFATLSILALYRRVFSAHRFFSISSLVLIVLTAVWWLSGTLCDIFSFRPARAYWDPTITGQYYINYNDFWLTSMLAELLIELAVLVLPIREIAKLNLSRRKKAFIVSMFLMGGFVLITGVVRIYYAWGKSDMTPGVMWLSVHGAVAIISANLPTYRPLLVRLPGAATIPSNKDTYTHTYASTRNRRSPRRLSTITKRTVPFVSTDPTTLSSRKRGSLGSIDTNLISATDVTQPTSLSDSTVAHDGDNPSAKSFELHDFGHAPSPQQEDFGGRSAANGVTRKISIPSPTSTDGGWGPLMDAHAFANGAEPPRWLWAERGLQTKRAELEFERAIKQIPSTGLAT